MVGFDFATADHNDLVYANFESKQEKKMIAFLSYLFKIAGVQF